MASVEHIDVARLREEANAEREQAPPQASAAAKTNLSATPKGRDRGLDTVVLDIAGMRCMKNCGTPVQNVLRAADLSTYGESVVSLQSPLCIPHPATR